MGGSGRDGEEEDVAQGENGDENLEAGDAEGRMAVEDWGENGREEQAGDDQKGACDTGGGFGEAAGEEDRGKERGERGEEGDVNGELEIVSEEAAGGEEAWRTGMERR